MNGVLPNLPTDASVERQKAEMARVQKQVMDLKSRLNGGKDQEKELRKVCQDFEAIFMGKLWQQMRNSVPKEGYLHSKFEDQYVSMFDHEMSKKLAQSGGIGLADMMYEQMSQQSKMVSTPSGVTPEEKKEIRSLNEKDMEVVFARKAKAAQAATPLDPGTMSDTEALQRANALAARITGRQMADSVPAGTPGSGFRPVMGEAVKDYGWETNPLNGHRSFNPGTTYLADSGSSVQAAWSGEVLSAGPVTGGGNQIVLQHDNGIKTRYRTFGDLSVSRGQRVSAGEDIAIIPANESRAERMTTFEVRKKAAALDPETYLHQVTASLPGESDSIGG